MPGVVVSSKVNEAIVRLLSVAVACANTGSAGQFIVEVSGSGSIIGLTESPSRISNVAV
ncbi:hypothetical protein GIY83_03305 [Flavobacterium sp. SLB02]|nr:hypothetical protein GIY83_03305 [Flavobacterium sp. SLB02]